MRTRAECRIGTSGYQYEHWRGAVYDQKLPRRNWFGRYAEVFDTVEINNTFNSLPEAKTFDSWRERAPQGFLCALKYSRYGSHLKRPKDPGDTAGKFLARASRLGSRLGPILVQLPPNWHADADRLAAFLDAVPAERRWALELRHRDWPRSDIFEILSRHKAALCIHDMIDRHPVEVTADWVYLRFHGRHYGGSYSHQFLSAQAQRIDAWLGEGLDVFVYFNNDAHGFAVGNARDLRRYVGKRRHGE